MLGLATLGATTKTTGKSGHPIYGVAVGTVSDINDPLKQGRVQVLMPWLDDNYVANWARCVQLGAGATRRPHQVDVAEPLLVPAVAVSEPGGQVGVPAQAGLLGSRERGAGG